MTEQAAATKAAPSRATCIREPRGDGGLEGYALGEAYRFEHVPSKRVGTIYCNDGVVTDKSVEVGHEYYRVWPTAGEAYYETCSPRTFKKFFKIET